MAQLKKQAKEEIVATLNKHLEELRWDLAKNKVEMHRIVKRQTITKRKMAEITKIINTVLPYENGV